MEGAHCQLVPRRRGLLLLLAAALILGAVPVAWPEEEPLSPDIEFFTNRNCPTIQ